MDTNQKRTIKDILRKIRSLKTFYVTSPCKSKIEYQIDGLMYGIFVIVDNYFQSKYAHHYEIGLSHRFMQIIGL